MKLPLRLALHYSDYVSAYQANGMIFFYQSNLIMAFLEKYTGKRKKEIQSQQESKTMFVSWIFFISLWVLWVLKPK